MTHTPRFTVTQVRPQGAGKPASNVTPPPLCLYHSLPVEGAVAVPQVLALSPIISDYNSEESSKLHPWSALVFIF